MMTNLESELNYYRKSLNLVSAFFRKHFIHCNLQVTYRCNFECQICDFWKDDYDKTRELSLKDVEIISKKLSELGTIIVSLAGGEPLIRKDLYQIIGILNKNHFPILITNGWYINEENSKAILRAGLQEISVSVDYANPAKHDTQRGAPGAFDKAINALKLLRKNRPYRRNRIHMITVLMDDNLEEIEPLIKLSREIGVTYMVNLYSFNRGTKTGKLPANNVTQYLLSLKKKYPEFITLHSYIERLDQAISKGGIGNCQTGRLLLNIDNKGNVARCTETLGEPVGNILTQSMTDIRRSLWDRYKNQDCALCWTSCRGFVESMYTPPRWKQFKDFLITVKPR